MAGTIVIILVFGLLMSISMAFMKMVQTEMQVQDMVDHSDRAADAAFSGVNYAISVVQDNPSLFKDNAADFAKRTYIVSPHSDWGGIIIMGGMSNLVASISSDWVTLGDVFDNFQLDGESATPTYQFRVTTYPAADTSNVIIPYSYMVKSQGRFLIKTPEGNVLATFTSQILAECVINPSRHDLRLRRYRFMPYVSSDPIFFKATQF